MNKTFLIIIICLFSTVLVYCQVGEKFLKLPKKYELPSIKTTLEPSDIFTEEPWRVYADRDSVLVYSNSVMDVVTDTLYFMQEFVVWEETDRAIRLVNIPDSGTLLSEGSFSIGCIEKGWVDKQKMILWPRVLVEDGITIKVVISKNTNATVYNDGKISNDIVVPDSGIKLFNILKIDNKDFLLCNTDLLYKNLTRQSVFWMNSENLNVIWDRKAIIPDWEKVNNGQVFYVFENLDLAIEGFQEKALDSFPAINPYLGFLNPETNQDNIYSAQLFLNQRDKKVFINNLHNDFKIAQLVDYNQFLVLKEFFDIFHNSLIKNELEDNLLSFFRQRGVSEEDLNGKNIRELLELVCGLKLSSVQSDEIVRISEMKETDFRFNYLIFNTSYEKFTSEKIIETYSFYSDILYYWLPESWIRPDLLSSIKLSPKEIKITKIRKRRNLYSDFELVYIDNSAPSEEKTFEQLQAEIIKCNKILTRNFKKETSDIKVGHILFYSNTLNPIIGKENATLNNIILAMRTDKTAQPIRLYDKNLLENKLLIDDIENVENTLNIHYFISDHTFEEEINDRALLLNEFPQRLKSIVAENALVNVFLYMYDNKENKYQMENLINIFIQKQNNDKSNIKYSLYKFN